MADRDSQRDRDQASDMIHTTRYTRDELAKLLSGIRRPITGAGRLPGLPPMQKTPEGEFNQVVDQVLRDLDPNATPEIVRLARGTERFDLADPVAEPRARATRVPDQRVDTIAEIAPRASLGAGAGIVATVASALVAVLALANLLWAMTPASDVLGLIAAPATALFAIGALSFVRLPRWLITSVALIVGLVIFASMLVLIAGLSQGGDVATLASQLGRLGPEALATIGALLSSAFHLPVHAAWCLVAGQAALVVFVGAGMSALPVRVQHGR